MPATESQKRASAKWRANNREKSRENVKRWREENPEKAIASLREAARRVREERLSLWVFAEGHRNTKPELLKFKKGAFHIAVEAQVPIVPVVCESLDAVLDGGRWLVRPGTIRGVVMDGIPTAGLAEADVDALAASVRGRMQAQLDAWRAAPVAGESAPAAP